MSHACPLFKTTQQPDMYLHTVMDNCGNCVSYTDNGCKRVEEVKLLGKENKSCGVVKLTKQE